MHWTHTQVLLNNVCCGKRPWPEVLYWLWFSPRKGDSFDGNCVVFSGGFFWQGRVGIKVSTKFPSSNDASFLSAHLRSLQRFLYPQSPNNSKNAPFSLAHSKVISDVAPGVLPPCNESFPADRTFCSYTYIAKQTKKSFHALLLKIQLQSYCHIAWTPALAQNNATLEVWRFIGHQRSSRQISLSAASDTWWWLSRGHDEVHEATHLGEGGAERARGGVRLEEGGEAKTLFGW